MEETKLGRREFICAAAFMPYILTNLSASDAQPTKSSQTANKYSYRVSGRFRRFGIEKAISGELQLAEDINLEGSTYSLKIEGRLDVLDNVSVISQGVIHQNLFRPIYSSIHTSGLIPKLFGIWNIDIRYYYDALTPYAEFSRGWFSWNVPLEPNKRLDDLGTAYLNYKYGKIKPVANSFHLWMLAKLKPLPHYIRLTVFESAEGNSIVLTTADFHKFLKGVNENSKTTAKLSLEHRIIEEAKIRVHSNDVSFRRVS